MIAVLRLGPEDPDGVIDLTAADLVLRDGARAVARLRIADGVVGTVRDVRAEHADGGAWHLTTWGRGWRLAAVDEADGAPLLWYRGGVLRSGGTFVVAPDARLTARSRWHRRRDLQVRDRDGRLVLDVAPRVTSSRWLDEVRVDVHAAPPVERPDPLVAFAALLPVLMFRHDRIHRLGRAGGGIFDV